MPWVQALRSRKVARPTAVVLLAALRAVAQSAWGVRLLRGGIWEE